RPVVSYRGTINGDPATKVSLHYSEGSLTGFMVMANGRRTVVGRDFSSARFSGGTPHTVADEVSMFGMDPLSKFFCGNDALPVDEAAIARLMVMPTKEKASERTQADYLREFRMAMVVREDVDSVMKLRGETDEEIVQYFMKIAAAMAQAYEQDLDAMLYVGYFEKFTKDVPSGLFNNGADPGQLLYEFSRRWSQTKNSVNRTVAHCYTLIRPSNGTFVGGIAFLGTLCEKAFGGAYGVSTLYLNASEIPGDPNRGNGFVWDVFVSAHEMGHNIGAPHTHSCYWNPAIDTCQLKSDGTDACHNDPSLRRIIPGTIMSYCHLANGSSTPLTFGPRASQYMRSWLAESTCAPFVTKPTVQITEPRGSDTYNYGERMTIRWASARVARVNIYWGLEKAGPWTSIASSIDAVDRQYLWTIPVMPGPNFWIRIQDASNASVLDTSLASYRFATPVILDAPKGGERLGQGSVFNIRWTKSDGLGDVKLEFSPDGSNYQTLLASSDATSYQWTVPVVLTDNARIKVAAVAIPQAPSISGAFSIGARRFTLELPAENSFLCKNKVNLFQWTSDFIPTIRFQYSTDNGANWRTATQQSTIDATLGSIFSRNVNMNSVPSGTKLLLRVIDPQTEEVLATRNLLRMDSCGIVSVEETQTEPSFSIVSIAPNPASTTIRLDIGSLTSNLFDVVLITNDGRETFLRQGVSASSGTTTIDVPLADVASGAYRVCVRSNGVQVVAPLVITR
ncbi:MAG: hypothetical protein H7X70_03590, partial [Candidatus Kapabacteria bacterium]|nr:hypothetical protein [Candidatus Kapabacteria bacterium]